MSGAGVRPPLAVRRLSPADWRALADDPRLLGGLVYGDGAEAADAAGLDVLSAAGTRIDAWLARGETVAGRTGAVRWRHDGEWLYAAAEFDAGGSSGSLEAVARQAYRDVFATLARTGFAQVARFWNYLPGINDDGGGLERYRQFNAGRQAAFLEAGAAASEGAPAACALGTARGPLRVRLLACRAAPQPVDNPRQVPAWRYPADYGPRPPSFSRAALAPCGDGGLALFVSGTASIVGHETVHAGDPLAQARETLANLQAVVRDANARGGAGFELGALDCVVYLRRAQDLPAVRAAFEEAVGAGSPAARGAVYLRADICRADLLVEIEAHGFAPGDLRGASAAPGGAP
jgi:enamine deaminase RidA (YjgF/YER057c/UK114 family)